MRMIIMPPNEKWSDLTAREKAPFVLRGTIQFVLLAAALVWSAVAFVNFMGVGPIAYFAFGRKRA